VLGAPGRAAAAEEDARRERERVEREARLAREQAEREERERQDLETARAWWGRLSPQQQTELFAAVAEYAWRESNLRVEVPEKPMMWPQYARGVPVHVADKRRTLYGIVRPCPDLTAACPTIAEELVLARSAHEARELAAVLPQGRIVHLDLPEHELLNAQFFESISQLTRHVLLVLGQVANHSSHASVIAAACQHRRAHRRLESLSGLSSGAPASAGPPSGRSR
jgi:hypothetical protein